MIKNNYHLHLIGGVIIGLILSTTFEGVPIFIQYLFTTFIATVSGIAWEWFWKMYNDSEIDYRDVLWSTIGAVTSLTLVNILTSHINGIFL
jgi:hypothetical protein